MSGELTRDQKLQLCKKLPEDLKEAMFSMRTAEINWDLAEKYDVNKVSTFAELIGEVLLGILPPEEFGERLRKDLGIKPEVSEALSKEVEELIFDPVRESLDQLYKKGINSFPQVAKSKGYEHFREVMMLTAEGNEFDQEILSHANLALELGLSTSEEVLVHIFRMNVYMRQRRFSEAEVEIRKALELDKKLHDPLHYFLAYKHLSEIYEERGQVSYAIESLKNAIIEFETLYDPNEEAEKATLALAYCRLGKIYLTHSTELPSAEEQAFQNLQRALEDLPEYPALYVYLGELHGNKEFTKFYNLQKAIEYYERFLALISSDDPRRKMAHNHLALLKKESKEAEGKQTRKSFFKKLFG